MSLLVKISLISLMVAFVAGGLVWWGWALAENIHAARARAKRKKVLDAAAAELEQQDKKGAEENDG